MFICVSDRRLQRKVWDPFQSSRSRSLTICPEQHSCSHLAKASSPRTQPLRKIRKHQDQVSRRMLRFLKQTGRHRWVLRHPMDRRPQVQAGQSLPVSLQRHRHWRHRRHLHERPLLHSHLEVRPGYPSPCSPRRLLDTSLSTQPGSIQNLRELKPAMPATAPLR